MRAEMVTVSLVIGRYFISIYDDKAGEWPITPILKSDADRMAAAWIASSPDQAIAVINALESILYPESAA